MTLSNTELSTSGYIITKGNQAADAGTQDAYLGAITKPLAACARVNSSTFLPDGRLP